MPTPPIDAFDGWLAERAADGRFSGVVRVTRAGHELYAAAVGSASRAWDVPVGFDTRFDIASITKLFTSVAALQLVDEGAFALDTPVVPYLGLHGTAIHPEVTLGQLLSHTSGIGDDADEEAGEDYADLWKLRPNYGVRQTIDMLPQFVHRPATFAPGEGCRYCNVGFVLAGLMIERATGTTYRDRVRERVFAPAGMADSGFFSMDLVAPRVAEGADPIRDADGRVTGWRRNIYSYPPVGSPADGAHVTAADLERFLRAVQAGRLLSEASTAAFFRPVALHSAGEGRELRYGYGLEFVVDPGGRVHYYEKEGINAGVSAMLRHYPGHELTVVLLGTTQESVWEPTKRIDALVREGAFDG